MKRKHIIDFLTIVLFFGVLLSLTVYVGIGAFIDSRGEDEKTEGELFADSFYGDENLNYFIRYIDYKFFRHNDTQNILIGKDGWIFEMFRSKNGYNYMLDHIGEASFSEEELVRIKTNITREREYYQSCGIDYMVVIIPNSMTVCEDKIPAFLGARSENTRLAALSQYLSGESSYIDPTESLKAGCSVETPYNNTENSINAYGAYSIYSTVMSRIDGIRREPLDCLQYEDITFSVRMTDGKSAAERAGLEKIVQNRTVSLTDEMTGSYEIIERRWNCFTTVKKNSEAETPTLLIKFSNEWDRIQMMPFFSNTFDKVFYESGGIDLAFAAENHSPDIVLRMIRESELDSLLK
jgi:hypothetical protein